MAAPSVPEVCLEVTGGLAVLTIDRPQARNAIGLGTIEQLGTALDAIEGDDAIEVLVITGSGDRAFVSGGDLKELTAVRTHDDTLAMARRYRRTLDRIAALPMPVIAALNGHAIGGGAEFAVAADIRIAAEDIRIGFNQVTLGIIPAWGGMERLTALVGRSKALLAVASGTMYDAAAAQSLGLLDVVVPRAAFEDTWRATATAIAQRAPGTGRAVKAVVSLVAPALHPHTEQRAAEVFAPLWTGDTHWNAVDAFLNSSKR